MTPEQRKEFVAHCVKLLQEKDHYTTGQWTEAMLQLEHAAAEMMKNFRSHPPQRKKSFLENSCPADRD